MKNYINVFVLLSLSFCLAAFESGESEWSQFESRLVRDGGTYPVNGLPVHLSHRLGTWGSFVTRRVVNEAPENNFELDSIFFPGLVPDFKSGKC